MSKFDYMMLVFAILLALTTIKTLNDLTKLNTRANLEKVVGRK